MIDWRHWHNEPYLVGGLVILGWWWAVLAGPLRGRLAGPGTPYPRTQAIRFYAALVIFYLAVGSPLDQVSERFLFSAHMYQHQLLTYPAAILFLLGLTPWMVDPVLGRAAWRRPLRVLLHPLSCAILSTLVFGLWHAPYAYDLALQNKLVHVLEHVMFFGAALLYWWPMLSPSRALPPVGYGAQMLYFTGALILMTPVYAYITFSDDILYPTYEYAPRLFANFSAMDDQLLAGVSMKIVGMGVGAIALAIAFYKWFQAGERAEKNKGGS